MIPLEVFPDRVDEKRKQKTNDSYQSFKSRLLSLLKEINIV